MPAALGRSWLSEPLSACLTFLSAHVPTHPATHTFSHLSSGPDSLPPDLGPSLLPVSPAGSRVINLTSTPTTRGSQTWGLLLYSVPTVAAVRSLVPVTLRPWRPQKWGARGRSAGGWGRGWCSPALRQAGSHVGGHAPGRAWAGGLEGTFQRAPWAPAETDSGEVVGARGSGLARMASTEKEDARRPGARGGPGFAEPGGRAGDAGPGERLERWGWTPAPERGSCRQSRGPGLGIARPLLGRAQEGELGPLGCGQRGRRGRTPALNKGASLVGQERSQLSPAALKLDRAGPSWPGLSFPSPRWAPPPAGRTPATFQSPGRLSALPPSS